MMNTGIVNSELNDVMTLNNIRNQTCFFYYAHLNIRSLFNRIDVLSQTIIHCDGLLHIPGLYT